MKMQLKGRVLEVFEAKSGIYVTMNDTEEGGSIKLSFPLGTAVKIDALLNINAVIKPGIGNFGQFLKVTQVLKEGG